MEAIEHSIEDNPDFHEEVVLNGSNIDNILLHEKCLFIGLEENIEVGPK